MRLRMVQSRDGTAIRALLADEGLAFDELELARLLRFDPRRRAVICASTLVGIREEVIGLGAIDLGARSPDLVVVDAERGGALRDLLTGALCGRAEAHAA